ncbi:MAG: phage protease [Methanoregula sp.]
MKKFEITEESLAKAKLVYRDIREKYSNYPWATDAAFNTGLDALCVPVEECVTIAEPEWVKILPLGKVELADHREPFMVDEASLESMVAAFRDRGFDLVIDYNYATLNGGAPLAAGWIKDLEARSDGLWVLVEWTDIVKKYMNVSEYRYVSPVLRLDQETRRPTALIHVALTKAPAINNLPPFTGKLKQPKPFGPGTRLRAANGDEMMVVLSFGCFRVVNLTQNILDSRQFVSAQAVKQALLASGAVVED